MGELVEDHLGSGGPDEGFGRGIVILDEAVDGGLKTIEVVAALATVLWHFWRTCSRISSFEPTTSAALPGG